MTLDVAAPASLAQVKQSPRQYPINFHNIYNNIWYPLDWMRLDFKTLFPATDHPSEDYDWSGTLQL